MYFLPAPHCIDLHLYFQTFSGINTPDPYKWEGASPLPIPYTCRHASIVSAGGECGIIEQQQIPFHTNSVKHWSNECHWIYSLAEKITAFVDYYWRFSNGSCCLVQDDVVDFSEVRRWKDSDLSVCVKNNLAIFVIQSFIMIGLKISFGLETVSIIITVSAEFIFFCFKILLSAILFL